MLRHGYVLLAVLWIMVGVASLGVVASLAGRDAVAAAKNRVDHARAMWRAEDCVERARAVIGGTLGGELAGPGGEKGDWTTLDRVVLTSPLLAIDWCEVSIYPAGTTADLNAADAEFLHALFLAMGIPAERADSMVDALLDWCDPDDVPRPLGAEREWYAERGRHLPRNGSLADLRELERVRGFEKRGVFDHVLGVEPGRIALDHAAVELLAALPGFTGETVARIAERRGRGLGVGDLRQLTEHLSASASAALMARYADLARLTTVEPDAWIVAARASVGTPPVTVVIEVRLARAGNRAATVRKRMWWS